MQTPTSQQKLLRVRLSNGSVLFAGGGPPNPPTLTLGRTHVGKGAKKRDVVSREACVIDATGGSFATVAALAKSREPVSLWRKKGKNSSVWQSVRLSRGGSPVPLRDGDVIQLCPSAATGDGKCKPGNDEGEEEARKQRVVVEVEGFKDPEQQEEQQPPQQPRRQRQQQQQQQRQQQQQKKKPILIVLVGLPGSGKTTLAKALVAHAAAKAEVAAADSDDEDEHDEYHHYCGSGDDEHNKGGKAGEKAAAEAAAAGWVRVSGDALAGGGGNHASCLREVDAALSKGLSVVLDRTDQSSRERAPFLSLAERHGAERHALFLDRERQHCVDRAYLRKEHEGGLCGTSE